MILTSHLPLFSVVFKSRESEIRLPGFLASFLLPLSYAAVCDASFLTTWEPGVLSLFGMKGN